MNWSLIGGVAAGFAMTITFIRLVEAPNVERIKVLQQEVTSLRDWRMAVGNLQQVVSALTSRLEAFERQLGFLPNRVDELERWRQEVRTKLHEVANKLNKVVIEIQQVHTMIDERTERRDKNKPRDNG